MEANNADLLYTKEITNDVGHSCAFILAFIARMDE